MRIVCQPGKIMICCLRVKISTWVIFSVLVILVYIFYITYILLFQKIGAMNHWLWTFNVQCIEGRVGTLAALRVTKAWPLGHATCCTIGKLIFCFWHPYHKKWCRFVMDFLPVACINLIKARVPGFDRAVACFFLLIS